MNKPLTVYKASAGSGKTFTLAVEYIKLLVLNPQSYRTILAVTFTNKATEEMKTRILSQLYGIWKQLDDSKTYTERICHDLDMAPEIVAQRAGTALKLLIHNYGYFRIETIDSFFQTVLRNLARELDLTANLRIELNDSQVEEFAVDRLIEELDKKNEILRLIMDYINDKIADDKSWNVIRQIKSFGKTIFRDFYKEESRSLAIRANEPGFMRQYMASMKREMDEAKATMEQIADEFFDTLDGEGITVDDLAHKDKGVAGLFLKLKRGVFDEKIVGVRVLECLDNDEKWCSKTHKRRDAIHTLAASSLRPLLLQALDEQPGQWKRYKSAELTLRHLYQLRLLGSIERKVRELNEDANRFLLSDTQQLLHSLIQGSDSPFIFEKIGTQLEHVMIDEFQDTSSVQWRNFKVLLLECMSRENASNLIVGDVKQSIYRWRSGDWRLLNDIESQFERPEKLLAVESLKVNFRSADDMIRFNNAFFKRAVEAECEGFDGNAAYSEQLRNAYSDVEQSTPDNREEEEDDDKTGGYVGIKLLCNDDYEQRTLEETAEIVARLRQNGIKQGDIAILVRTNNNIPLIAKHITENLPDVKIVADEAFRLDASLAVCTIIQALRLLTHNNDLLTRANLTRTYQVHVLGNDITDFELEASRNEGNGDCLLPEEYAGHMEELAAMPLYDLAERLYAVFRLDRISGQSAYVCAFYDYLGAFTQDNIADIDSFLEEWDNSIYKKTIQNDEPDGIRLITIHKSKGLEFKNVIIPFCDWQLEKSNNNILWCKPGEAPFNELPIVPIDYSKKGMKGTIYEKHYMDEYMQNCVDNLNLLYVAFTRAKKRLFVIGKRDATGSRSQLIQTCLPDIAEQLDGAITTPEEDKGDITFEFGDNGDVIGREAGNNTTVASTTKRRKKNKSDNVFKQRVEPVEIGIETFDNKTEFVQSNQSRDFIEGDEDEETSERREYIKTGSLLHRLFSRIATVNDIAPAVKELETEGLTDRRGAENLERMLRKRLAGGMPADWFSGNWQLYNECSILSVNDDGDVTERRPDRVMTDGNRMIVVDFKFGKPNDDYRDQVAGYVKLLKDMGNNNVEGYLWYVYNNKIEKV